jgi:hypothetical protein
MKRTYVSLSWGEFNLTYWYCECKFHAGISWVNLTMVTVQMVKCIFEISALLELRIHILFNATTDWRNGLNSRLLRKRSRIRFPHSTNICVHKHVCMYLQKKSIYVCIFIRYQESITYALFWTTAYFGLDQRECECLKYLFIYLNI